MAVTWASPGSGWEASGGGTAAESLSSLKGCCTAAEARPAPHCATTTHTSGLGETPLCPGEGANSTWQGRNPETGCLRAPVPLTQLRAPGQISGGGRVRSNCTAGTRPRSWVVASLTEEEWVGHQKIFWGGSSQVLKGKRGNGIYFTSSQQSNTVSPDGA